MTDPIPSRPPDARPLVTIRPAGTLDAVWLERWRAEPTVRQHQPLSHASTAQIKSELSRQNPADLYRGRGDKFQWIILANSRPAGWITLVVTNWEHGLGEIGYALSTVYQRQGLMRTALEFLLDDLFHNTSLARVEARCSVENQASSAVLEAIGFTREGLLRQFFVLGRHRIDNYLYSILRTDWCS